MSDEFEEIKRRRMEELRKQYGNQSQMSQQEHQERLRQAEEQRNIILMQILTSEARERLSRIALVKPEKARQIEDSLIRAAQMRQLGGKVTERQLIQMLEQSQPKSETKITIKRRTLDDDDF